MGFLSDFRSLFRAHSLALDQGTSTWNLFGSSENLTLNEHVLNLWLQGGKGWKDKLGI